MKSISGVPRHVAIIPDGNRRWAKEKGLNPWDGHEEGAKNFEKLVQSALNKGIECLSIWGSSVDNLVKRPLAEKKALLDIYKRYFKRLIDEKEIYKNEVRVTALGRWEEQFPESLKKIIWEIMNKTRHFKKKMLNFMLAYSGIDDMLQAMEKINAGCEKGERVTPFMVKKNLMTVDLPPVDFTIRTGGEPHNSSGFLMWDSADAQLYFSQDYFPDFNEEKFTDALEDFSRRARRFGS